MGRRANVQTLTNALSPSDFVDGNNTPDVEYMTRQPFFSIDMIKYITEKNIADFI